MLCLRFFEVKGAVRGAQRKHLVELSVWIVARFVAGAVQEGFLKLSYFILDLESRHESSFRM